jgi:hypothetical protein
MKKSKVCIIGILLLLSISCNVAEQTISVSSREPSVASVTQEKSTTIDDATLNATQQVGEAIIQATLTVTVTPSLEPTSTIQPSATPLIPTPTSQTESSTVSLPPITFGVATQAYQVTCLQTDILGQIWVSSYPYEQAELLLANDTISYIEPSWSPNGIQLAVIETLVEDSKITTQNNGRWTQYKEQISILNIEDKSIIDIDKQFDRLEFFSNENSGCGVASRISSIIGWSQNGEWLAYIAFETDEPGKTASSNNLYVVNIETGKNILVATDVLFVTWVGTETTLAFNRSADLSKIELVEVSFEPIEKLVIDAPFNSNSKFSLFQIALPTNEMLYTTVIDNTSFLSPSTLWSYSLITSEWSQLEMERIDGKPGFVINAKNENLIICFEKDNVLKLRSVDVTTGTPIHDFEIPELLVTCDLALTDNLIAAYDRSQIWMVSIYDLNQEPEQIIDIHDMNIPYGYEINSITWMPQP